MAKFTVKENFQFGGSLRRNDSILEISDIQALAEKEKGKHEDNGRWLSGLLNHCDPTDQHTIDLLAGKVKPQREMTDEKAKLEDEKTKEIKRLRGEFDALGKAYNPKWAIDKLAKELKAAKKEVGDVKKDAPKKPEQVKTAKVADDPAEVERVRNEITAMGKTFHPRAGLAKLKETLENAKKSLET